MKISKKWLSQYMDLSDMSIEEIADKITSAGLEAVSYTHLMCIRDRYNTNTDSMWKNVS